MENLGLQDLKDLAWRDFIIWAFTHDQIRSDFERSTGVPPLRKAKSPLDLMVDEACGVKDTYFFEFSIWATAYLWGMDYAPLKMQEEWEKRKKENPCH